MTVLSVLATEYLYALHLERRITRNMIERTQSEYAAQAAIAEFVRAIAEDESPYDSMDEDWAQTADGELPDPQYEERVHAYRLTATDENARIDVNVIDEAFAERLLGLAGVDAAFAPTLAAAIVQARQERAFITPGDLARVEDMTTGVLYGGQASSERGTDEQATPLLNLITVFSVDKNVQSDGQARTNIATADANGLMQGSTDADGNALLSQAEADAIVAYRSETAFESVAHLLDAPAITQEVLDGARDNLSTEDEDDRVNINTAGADELGGVEGLDQGTAEDVVRHREANGDYGSVDEIRDAKVFTIDELKAVVDKTTISDEETLRGVVNVNTADQQVLALLPGMDDQKAQAIIERRGGNAEANGGETTTESQPFQSTGELLDVEGIDEETFKQMANFVTYRTQVFRVEAQGLDAEDKAIASIEAVLDRSAQSVQIRFWRTR